MKYHSGDPSKIGSWPHPQTLAKAGKNLPRTNTLAYYEHSQITEENVFITLDPGRRGLPVANTLAYLDSSWVTNEKKVLSD